MAPAQDPRDVMSDALTLAGWQRWEPGDGTAYRVKVHAVIGGPDHADRVLLISCGGRVAAVQYADPAVAAYRVEYWTRERWRRERRNPDPGYDWWPTVVKPLLLAVGVARGPLETRRRAHYAGPAARQPETLRVVGGVL